MNYMTPEEIQPILTEYAIHAAECLEDAGVRYMATYYESASDEGKTLALAGWMAAITVLNQRNAHLLTYLATVDPTLDPAQAIAQFREAFPQGQTEAGDRVRGKINEYMRLLQLGEA